MLRGEKVTLRAIEREEWRTSLPGDG